jgi:DNA-binding FrmR family transcriptional regulator
VQVRNTTQDRSQNIARALANLRRIEGQVRALQRQLEEGADFISLLTQTAAASKALQSVAKRLVEEHLTTAMGDQDIKASHDLIEAVDRLLKV